MYIVNDDLLSLDLTKRLELKYQKANYRFFWAGNQFSKDPFYHWHHDILISNSDNTEDLTADLYSKPNINDEIMAWEMIQNKILGPSKILRCYVNGYTFGTEGMAHTDSKREKEKTVIIYLNEWKSEWGGETVIFNDNLIEQSVIPKLGRIFIFPSDKLHAARPVSRFFRGLRVVLVFKTASKNVIEETPEIKKLKQFLLDNGTDLLPHGNQTLFNHLLKTYEFLREWGAPEHLCLAGLFHSVYGTAYYHHDIKIEPNKIKELIGKKAEYLVWLFCFIDRKKVNLENNTSNLLPLIHQHSSVNLNIEELKDLSILAKANRLAHE